MSAFEEVKRVNIYSGRALAEELSKIRETLSKSSNDWKVSEKDNKVLALTAVIKYPDRAAYQACLPKHCRISHTNLKVPNGCV